jgi:hypothetical protein
MADYVELALVDDPDALLEVGVDYMEGAIPGFVARPGNVETVLLEANSQIAAEVVQQAEQVPPLAFAWAGESLFGIPPYAAVPATSSAAVTFAVDTPAGMIPAQAMLSVPHPSGESMIFTFDADVASPAGGGVVNVGVTALEAGENANGAFGAAELIDVIDGVLGVVVASAAAGGVDAESSDAYLDRLSDALTLLAPRPILPNDFAVMARQVVGIERSMALDLYQPGTDDNLTAPEGGPLTVEGTPVLAGAGVSPVARCVTTVVTGPDGLPPTQDAMHRAWALLDARREVNFLAYVIAPTYTTIDVQAVLHRYPGYADADVQSAAQAMLEQWLSPSTFGASTLGDVWATDNVVRIYEAIDYLNRADGVHYVVSVKLRVAGGAWSSTDVALSGVAALPLPGDFSNITFA